MSLAAYGTIIRNLIGHRLAQLQSSGQGPFDPISSLREIETLELVFNEIVALVVRR